MRGAIPPLPQNAFMAWCSVRTQGQLYIYTFQKDLLTAFILLLCSGLCRLIFLAFIYGPRHRWEDNIEVDLKQNRLRVYGLDSPSSV
jgi:hypothetical protein